MNENGTLITQMKQIYTDDQEKKFNTDRQDIQDAQIVSCLSYKISCSSCLSLLKIKNHCKFSLQGGGSILLPSIRTVSKDADATLKTVGKDPTQHWKPKAKTPIVSLRLSAFFYLCDICENT